MEYKYKARSSSFKYGSIRGLLGALTEVSTLLRAILISLTDLDFMSFSVFWDYAMTIPLEEIVYLHCHQQGGSTPAFILKSSILHTNVIIVQQYIIMNNLIIKDSFPVHFL